VSVLGSPSTRGLSARLAFSSTSLPDGGPTIATTVVSDAKAEIPSSRAQYTAIAISSDTLHENISKTKSMTLRKMHIYVDRNDQETKRITAATLK
jgi:hypothetical protein